MQQSAAYAAFAVLHYSRVDERGRIVSGTIDEVGHCFNTSPAYEGEGGVMIPTFYINLDRHPDRRAFIEKQLTEIGIIAERISGVDGRHLPPDIAKCFSFANHLTDGEVGCAASHLKVWQIIVDRDVPASLILEDDALLSAAIANVLPTLLSTLPSDWDIVRLCRTSKRAVRPIAKLPEGRMLVRYSRVPVGAAGYLVSRSGAVKLLRPRHIDCPCDIEIAHPWRLGLSVFGVEPILITQARSVIPSSIGNRGAGLPTWKRALPDPARIIHNLRQLGPYWWVRCLALNATRHLRQHNEQSLPQL